MVDNPNKCSQINNKLITTGSYGSSGNGISCTVVNPTPPSTFHIQNCYRDSTLAAGSYFILDTVSPQYTTPPRMNLVGRWRITTNAAAPVGMSVELTLVDISNNESKIVLLSAGTTSVYTPLSIYKNCNDIRLVSAHQLASTDVIRAWPDFAIANNSISCLLSANYKHNGLFMCCNAQDGTPRVAKLVSLPQIYSGVATNYQLYKWPSSNSGTTAGGVIYSVIYVDSATATAPGIRKRVQTPVDGQVQLLPGEACAWWRSASSNTLAVVTAQWIYVNVS